MGENRLLADIENYYSERVAEHGPSAFGVDWNGEEGQRLRFHQLCKILPERDFVFSINDIGCGYGALIDFLEIQGYKFNYNGYEISEKMIEVAKTCHRKKDNCNFVKSSFPSMSSDFSIASGIFNIRLGIKEAAWNEHVVSLLDFINETSIKGFSFNCLTSYSDADRLRPHLHYADPCVLFDLCKKRYSKQVALLHDYGLYEFTILVRKSMR